MAEFLVKLAAYIHVFVLGGETHPDHTGPWFLVRQSEDRQSLLLAPTMDDARSVTTRCAWFHRTACQVEHTCGGIPVCDGRKVTCMGCGDERCHSEGSARGQCRGCLLGLLPGWSSCDRPCGYKGCTNRAAFGSVPGSVKSVCLACAGRPKVGRERLTLRDYIVRQAPHSPRGKEWGAKPAPAPVRPRYEVIEAKVWRRDDGRTVSPYGACPWTTDSEKARWTLVSVGFTVRDLWSGTIGVGRKPWTERADAQAWVDAEYAEPARLRS